MNRMMRPPLGLDLGEDGLEALLELAAVLGACDQRAHVERQQLLVLEALRHVTLDDALREALGDRCLATPGSPIRTGIVLGTAPTRTWMRAPDLLVAADDRVELALGRRGGEVARVALRGVMALLGRGTVGGAALAQIADGAVRVWDSRRLVQGAAGVRRGLHGQRQQQALDGHELVARFLCQLLGSVEGAGELGAQVHLASAAAGHLRALGRRALDGGEGVARAAPGALNGPAARPSGSSTGPSTGIGPELLMTFAQGEDFGRPGRSPPHGPCKCRSHGISS